MTVTVCCTESEVTELVYAFYRRVRQDPELGPIFNSHIEDWDRHLVKLVDFWSSILRRTARFYGAPMPKHAALPGLTAELFRHWVALFRQTAAEQSNQVMAAQACLAAERIAQSLWMGYQISQHPDAVPSPLARG